MVAPYAWAFGLEGDTGIGDHVASIDESFLDIMDQSDSIAALQGRAEVQYRHIGAFVDGGVFAQSFFIGNLIDLKALSAVAHPDWTKPAIQRLYVIRNGRIDPVGSDVKRSIGSISGKAIASLMKVSGINDLYRLYLGQVTGELELRYIAFPIGYKPLSTEGFNQEGNDPGIRPRLRHRGQRRAVAEPAACLSAVELGWTVAFTRRRP